MNINIQRLKANLLELSKFGFCEEDNGVYRQGFTPADMEARNWLLGKMKAEGFSAHMDEVANVIGHYGPDDAPAILIGSHLDSVPAGGIFDGSLGVMVGLECMQCFKEEGIELKNPVKVIATSEEEGRFGGMLGAQALTGNLTMEWLEQARAPSGLLLIDAMKDCGFDYRDALKARLNPEDIKAFFEIHIEQGPVLEAEKIDIGVVEGISGIFSWQVQLVGKADHSGTAPMEYRRDAFRGVADFAHEIPKIIEEVGTKTSRITIGRVEVKPNFPHTVPGEVNFTIVGRDLSSKILKKIAEVCHRKITDIAQFHNLEFNHEELSWLEPSDCDKKIRDMLLRLSDARRYSNISMPSGAGHDAQFFSDITPTGLIFIPSVGGVSHSPAEWTDWEDVERGANILLDAVTAMAI